MADIPGYTEQQQFYVTDLPRSEESTDLPESSRRVRLERGLEESGLNLESLRGKLEKDNLIKSFERNVAVAREGGHYTEGGNWVEHTEHPFDAEK